jgi:hypothetical protein
MVNLEFVGDYRQPQLTARQRELGYDGESDGEFSFEDFLDIINPLQHIPVLSTLYREITGDEISATARVLGGTLFGGPTGFLSAAANALYEEIAGEDIGESVLALFSDDAADATPQFAQDEDGGALPPEAAGAPAARAALNPPALTTAAGPAAPTPDSAVLPDPGQGMPRFEGSPGMLTGQDALNALFLDLRASPSPQALSAASAEARPLPGPQDEARKFIPLPPRMIRVGPAAAPQAPTVAGPAGPEASARQAAAPKPAVEAAASHPLLVTQEVPDAAIAERMMAGLDKYRAMSKQRQAAQPDSTVRWRADPTSTEAGGS